MDKFRNPPSEYRSVPFWSWNDALDKGELLRQIEEMHKAGIGGFFMHARQGLRTPYMGEEWMAAVEACIEKARELGMHPWLYDENGWPSGFADGKVPAIGAAYQQKRLICQEAPFPSPAERTIAYFAKTPQGYRRLPAGEESGADLRVFYEVNPYYTDTLSMEAVRAFLKSTHEVYGERLGEEFGGVLRGVFTDEPQFARGQLPWSFELAEEFALQNGYDLKEVLPDLFFETGSCSKTRYDYWRCVTEMFTRAFAKQIGDWCRGKGWLSTGHVVDEPALMRQVTSTGDPMAFYEYLHIPGCDWLGRFIGEEPIVPKQVSSVARQLGRKMAITESFGCAGWNVGFDDLKRIGEWQFVHGINMLCQHLQSYSLRGGRKRDYPPSLYFQQPWWEHYKSFNDYFTRLSMLLAEGTRQAEVLLLHPVRSAWVKQRGEDAADIEPYHRSFAQLTRWMCQSLIEHDYGSESIIERHGRVEGGRFIVGEAVYRVVVMPPSVTISRATAALLAQFVRQGGRLIAFPPFPELIDGERNEELDRLIAGAVRPEWSAVALAATVTPVSPPFLRITDEAGDAVAADTLNAQTLVWEGVTFYYLVNSGRESYLHLHVELRGSGTAVLLDLETGEAEPIRQSDTECGVMVLLELRPGQSRMLMLLPERNEQDETGLSGFRGPWFRLQDETDSRQGNGQPERQISLDGVWRIVHADPNSLTLDTCRFRIEDGEWSEVTPVVLLQDRLLAYGRPVQVELEFEFQVRFNVDAPRDMFLVLENPENFFIELNGQPVAPESCGWWRDASFRKLDIAGRVANGTNRIRLKTLFYNAPETYAAIEKAKQFESEGNKLTFDTEIESIYLVGSFGVESISPFTDGERGAVHSAGPFVLTEPPQAVGTGDLVRQGFPFFAGKLHLQQEVVIDTGWSTARWSFSAPPDAIVTRLRVNGLDVRTFLWEPYEADITSFLRMGTNTVELELVGSCRNLLGPHHHIKGEVYKVGPDSFKDKPGWTDSDLDKNTCIYTERYTFVRFGPAASPDAGPSIILCTGHKKL